ncbi:MAG: 16S rRNA (cytosine(1402)-N(4))-methyltransferase RsmH [Sphaerochaetaceae bacterium]|nr:16S rRNA (cytosine(1402)-N(4))-methyltransferase RsmH [Sphaerochaetaceae bacterium]
MEYVHYSVLQREALELLVPPQSPSLMIDCTLGEGGHSKLFLERYPQLSVIGLDRDSEIIEKAKTRLAPFGDRFHAVNTWFDEFLATYDGKRPELVLFDLGISVFHYEESGRGFSFRKNEELDMRLDKTAPLTVEDIVNGYQEERLADIIYQFGEERYSRRIAAAICSYSRSKRITQSDELAEIIYKAVPPAYRYGRIHPATRTFQALRIEVNRELDRIEPALRQAIDLVVPGGRIGVISFHSLEDRKVKWLFKGAADGCTCPPGAMRCTCGGKPTVKILTKKPIIPTDEECRINPPSRSAKLRVVEKLEE